MKRVGIIGLGVISKYYKRGLCESDLFELSCVCDILENAPSRSIYSEYPFYTDYTDMIRRERPDYVVISTPPKTHFEIAKRCIEMGVSVIVEKPAVTDMREYDELLGLSKKNGCDFRVMYHFMKASEMLEFQRRFSAEKISEANVTILDTYSRDGKSINREQQNMGGAWLDSGVNALSMLACWFSFDKVELLSHRVQRCEETGLPIYALAELLIDGVRASITVDWRKNINLKTANLIYDGRPMEISSTEQRIIYDGKEYCTEVSERLESHYFNYFKGFPEKNDEKTDRRINEVLLLINEVLENA